MTTTSSTHQVSLGSDESGHTAHEEDEDVLQHLAVFSNVLLKSWMDADAEDIDAIRAETRGEEGRKEMLLNPKEEIHRRNPSLRNRRKGESGVEEPRT
jgi:hypothetical protein